MVKVNSKEQLRNPPNPKEAIFLVDFKLQVFSAKSKMTATDPPCPPLLRKWRTLYTATLPSLAHENHWPVHRDHCFARIIYDAVIGEDGPWTERIQSPAVDHMSRNQVEQCVAMAERFATGDLDLWEWDRLSLERRGRGKKGVADPVEGRSGQKIPRKNAVVADRDTSGDMDVSNLSKKRKRIADAPERSKPSRDIRMYFQEPISEPHPPSSSPKQPLPSSPSTSLPPIRFPPPRDASPSPFSPSPPFSTTPTTPSPILQKIHASPITPLRKTLYALLLQVPRGRYTTYAHLATALGISPRAVGSAMRNNPFAPDVPCHRVLASGGKIGGFGGEWGEGKKVARKVEMLRGEGVKFDGREVAVGRAWAEFVRVGDGVGWGNGGLKDGTRRKV